MTGIRTSTPAYPLVSSPSCWTQQAKPPTKYQLQLHRPCNPPAPAHWPPLPPLPLPEPANPENRVRTTAPTALRLLRRCLALRQPTAGRSRHLSSASNNNSTRARSRLSFLESGRSSSPRAVMWTLICAANGTKRRAMCLVPPLSAETCTRPTLRGCWRFRWTFMPAAWTAT